MTKRLSLTEAARQLGVTSPRVSALVRAGLLTAEPDPNDKRRRLVPAGQVEALAELRRVQRELAAVLTTVEDK